MTAKEKLLREILDLDEAEHAHIVTMRRVRGGGREMAPLPKGWGETVTGEPMAKVVAAVRRLRDPD